MSHVPPFPIDLGWIETGYRERDREPSVVVEVESGASCTIFLYFEKTIIKKDQEKKKEEIEACRALVKIS